MNPTSVMHAQALVADAEREPEPDINYLGRLYQYIAANGTESGRAEAKAWLASEER